MPAERLVFSGGRVFDASDPDTALGFAEAVIATEVRHGTRCTYNQTESWRRSIDNSMKEVGTKDSQVCWVAPSHCRDELQVASAFVLLAVLPVSLVSEIEPWRAVLMALLGTLWIWIAEAILS